MREQSLKEQVWHRGSENVKCPGNSDSGKYSPPEQQCRDGESDIRKQSNRTVIGAGDILVDQGVF